MKILNNDFKDEFGCLSTIVEIDSLGIKKLNILGKLNRNDDHKLLETLFRNPKYIRYVIARMKVGNSEGKPPKMTKKGKVYECYDYKSAWEVALKDVDLSQPDCSAWMIPATATNAVLDVFQENFPGTVIYRSDCIQTPGCSITDLSFISDSPDVILKDGAKLKLGEGNTITVKPYELKEIITNNYIAYASVIYANDKVSVGALFKYLKLPNEIKNPVLFPAFITAEGGDDNNPPQLKSIETIPIFVSFVPKRLCFRSVVHLQIYSDKDQKLYIAHRAINDYSKIICDKSVSIKKGINEITYVVRSPFLVKPSVIEIKPEANTITYLVKYYHKP